MVGSVSPLSDVGELISVSTSKLSQSTSGSTGWTVVLVVVVVVDSSVVACVVLDD